MGEARRRRLALIAGAPLAQDMNRCPSCGSFRTVIEQAPPLAMSHTATLMGVCVDCRTLWEAYPPTWSHDAVEAEPCDNCAFRPGSPESQDREAWKSLLTKLRLGREFKCHKGAPLKIDHEAGTIEFDEGWVRTRGRTCAGFVRALQAWPDWLDNRYSVGHVLTSFDQDRLLGGPAGPDLSELDEGDD